jgi:Histidine phosphatase superfamily (branch 1)
MPQRLDDRSFRPADHQPRIAAMQRHKDVADPAPGHVEHRKVEEPVRDLGIVQNIYVVTHPEATHHIEDRVGGWFDSELTDKGLGQAARIAESLGDRVGQSSGPALLHLGSETCHADSRRNSGTPLLRSPVGAACRADVVRCRAGVAGGR